MFVSARNLNLVGLAAAAAAMMMTTTPGPVDAFDYAIVTGDDTGLTLTDEATGITDLVTVFTDDLTSVEMNGVAWEYTGSTSNDTIVRWTLLLNGELADTGEVDIGDTERELPTSFGCGSFKPTKGK